MLHGMINVYKEKGYTSHDVVAKLRGIAGQKKIGHTGTLDPDAEGVLPVCLGNATKVCGLLTDQDKTYRAVLLLGVSTDTQDIGGTVLKRRETGGLETGRVIEVIQSFKGAYQQIPPMFSALKVNGKKLYQLAREGKSVDREARTVEIREIKILWIDLPRIEIEVCCSKGTYIRTLCHDIGETLGVGGCMESLLRTQSGRFYLEQSIRLGELQKAKEEGRIQEMLTPTDAIFEEYPKITIDPSIEKRLKNGNSLPVQDRGCHLADGAHVRVYDTKDRFSAIYQYVKTKRELQVVKMFPQ